LIIPKCKLLSGIVQVLNVTTMAMTYGCES